MHSQISAYFDNTLPKYQFSFRWSYSSNQCWLTGTDRKMKEEKDKGGKYVAFLTDLSTAFNCLHDLLIAKLHAYDFETDSLIYRIIKIGNNCNTQQEYFLEYPKVQY